MAITFDHKFALAGPTANGETFSTATLFVEAPPVSRGLPAFLLSLLLHGAVISVVALAFHAPRHNSTGFTRVRYRVQLIELQPPQIRQNLAAPTPHGSLGASQTRAANNSQGAGPAITHRKFELPVSAKFLRARQTLVQLETPPKLVMNEIAVPDVLLWTQKVIPPPRRKLVPPPPRDIPKPAQTLLEPPTLDLPNQEAKIADMRFSQLPLTSVPNFPVLPATTSPIKIKGPEESAQVPQTVSTSSNEQTAAHIVSIPSLPLHADSLIIVPPANQVAPSDNGQGKDNGQISSAGGTGATATAGTLTADPKQTEATAGESTGLAEDPGGAVQSLNGTAGTGASASAASGIPGAGVTTEATPTITQPKDGKFSVVVIGSSAAEAYPDSVGLMTGKVIYTVYLKVGLRKSWILQYCLPGPVEQQFRVKGNATPLDPPWPFLMLRPDLANSGADALMLHGFVNTDGRFEKLALVPAGGFPRKDLLLSSLRQWEFRPAKRDGQPIAVEVLLIIPEDTE